MRTITLALRLALITVVMVVPALALASPAEAGMGRPYQRLAKCESGGKWHINTGNGYYGGLQISPGTWRAYGGKKFARLPHRATKREQIRIGKRIRHGQGWGAWPHCSRAVGLR